MKQANLGLIFFPAFDWMISPGHPERQERLLYTRDQLTEEGLFDRRKYANTACAWRKLTICSAPTLVCLQ